MAQLMPLPLTVSCFSKIQIGFTFLVLAHPGSPGQRAVKRVCSMSYTCLLPSCLILAMYLRTDDPVFLRNQLVSTRYEVWWRILLISLDIQLHKSFAVRIDDGLASTVCLEKWTLIQWVVVCSQDFTVFGGSLSMAHARKICKVDFCCYIEPYIYE